MKPFDIIVGNPPYQGTGRKKLYIDFIDKAINNVLCKDGQLCFITPKFAMHFLLGHKTSQKKLNYLYVVNNIITGVDKYFNVGSDFCIFNLVNRIKTTETSNIDSIEIELEYMMVLPYNINKNAISIYKKCLNCKNELGRKTARISENLSPIENEEYKNKILYKIRTASLDFLYSNQMHKDTFKPKVLFPTIGQNAIIDYNHNLFPGTSFVVYCLTNSNEESENLVSFVNSKLYKYLCAGIKSMRSPSDWLLKNIKKPDLSIKLTNEDLYKYFNLSQEQIDLIETTIK